MNKSDFYYEENLERQLKTLQQENELLKQALNEIREYIYENSIPINLLSNPPKETLDFEGDITDILKIIDKYMKED